MNKSKIYGVSLITAGIACVGVTVFLHINAEQRLGNELNKRVVYSADSNKDSNEQGSSLAEVPELSPVDEDMVIDEITTYQNVLEVPSCNITVPLTEGVSREPLRRGAGHFTETPKIGEEGNACYAGHYSTVYSCIFNDLPNVQMYDEVIGYGEDGTKTTYYVIGKYVTTPDNISVLANSEGVKDLTIVTCSNNGTMRLIISCRALSEGELEDYKRESQMAKRESLYTINDSLGDVHISEYLSTEPELLCTVPDLGLPEVYSITPIYDCPESLLEGSKE